MVVFFVILGVIILLIIISLINHIRSNKAFYTASICDVCGEKTGFKGNRRFKLSRGNMCELCAEKATSDPVNFANCGPNAFNMMYVVDIEEAIKINKIKNKQLLADQKYEQARRMAETHAKEDATKVPTCFKCGSTSISANKKGFSVGKAALGAFIAGPLGLTAGGIGAKKIRITCLNCGNDWIAGADNEDNI